MTHKKRDLSYMALVVCLGIVLLLVIWRPVLPSAWVIEGMASQIDPVTLPGPAGSVIRFELGGKGGGDYNLLLSRDGVELTEGDTDTADLVLAMQAADFNRLMLDLASGRADQSVFPRLVISNVLRLAGDISVLELLDPDKKGES